MINIDKPGIYTMPEEAYHADPCKTPSLSRSIGQLIVERSAMHAFHAHPRLNTKQEPRKSSTVADIGTAAHHLLLRGDDCRVVLDFPDLRTRVAQEARDAAYAGGKTPLLRKNSEEIDAMLAALRWQLDKTDHAKNAFKITDNSEKVVVWQEEDVWMRCMIDNYDDYFVYDYKTTGGSAEPEQWIKSQLFGGNHLQPAFYPRGLKAIDGKDRGMIFIVQEQDAPYAVSVIALPPQALAVSIEQTDFAINVWSDCMRENRWPGYSGRTHWAEMPPWTINSWELKKDSLGTAKKQPEKSDEKYAMVGG